MPCCVLCRRGRRSPGQPEQAAFSLRVRLPYQASFLRLASKNYGFQNQQRPTQFQNNFENMHISKNEIKPANSSSSPFRAPPGFNTPWEHPNYNTSSSFQGHSPNTNSQASKNSNRIANPFDPIFDDEKNSQEAVFSEKVRSIWD